ncbi:MAG: hypothetical protein ACK4L7_09840, partial [Flavobacteriales bacterium]
MGASRRILLLAALPALGACRKPGNQGIPPVSVDISININNPAYADLAVPGGWLYLSGGSRGIIVYRSSPTEFAAHDRHCPYRPSDLCQVAVDSSQIIARDGGCCG